MSQKHFQPVPPRQWKTARIILQASCAAFVLALLWAGAGKGDQKAPEKIDEINNEFHFLGPQDTVLVHEEDGKLKGQINVYAGEEESDAVLSYIFTIGTRVNDHVEFKTSKVHEKYYRFSGVVERGAGHDDGDPDYLRLEGNLEIVTANGLTGKETIEQKHVVLKSLGAEEEQD
jgi:hypothetical protein